MAEVVKPAVLVEKNRVLRKQIISDINEIETRKIIECASPSSAHRPVIISNKSGLLIIGNDQKLDKYLDLISFCRTRLTNWTILVLDHLNTDESAAQAFTAGADDVLHVPYSAQEFKARLKLRLQQASRPKSNVGLNIKNMLAKAEFTQTELEIMNVLLTFNGKIVTRNQLAQHLENQDWIYGDRKYDVHITNIRKKLRDKLESRYTVKSVRSVGYYVQEIGQDNGVTAD